VRSRSVVHGLAVFLISFAPIDGLAADDSCWIDSVDGDDRRSGLSEAEEVESQARIAETCTTVRYRRGGSFMERLRVLDQVKSYGNCGDPSAALPGFELPYTLKNGPVADMRDLPGITIAGLSFAGASTDGFSTIDTETGVVLGANS